MAPFPIYSDHFFVIQGLNGTSATLTVPDDEVWVVKQITMYATPLVGTVHVFFHHTDYGATLFSHLFTGAEEGNVQFFGSLAFRSGESMDFHVSTTDPTDAADVYAGGYRLMGPSPF